MVEPYIASIIAMAGDKIHMAKGSMMMIHNPLSGGWGEAKDLR
ncbi:ATP-dependent Clp protease proteolytic subunit [Anaerobacillus isosaccharinicus]|uniref:ATP-dependent Clp protease proteolytic subunit n=1 Tax=Anaerobacillus isosaccharinicus TaxID=1532552 RepID=A0A7S7RDH2_9BACI|nr:ATP-dependent Clp protease proteolytic subunit [Anaerobacillus isosaccharinicus]